MVESSAKLVARERQETSSRESSTDKQFCEPGTCLADVFDQSFDLMHLWIWIRTNRVIGRILQQLRFMGNSYAALSSREIKTVASSATVLSKNWLPAVDTPRNLFFMPTGEMLTMFQTVKGQP